MLCCRKKTGDDHYRNNKAQVGTLDVNKATNSFEVISRNGELYLLL